MLDIKLLRENPELVKKNLKKRIDFDVTIVDKVLKIDTKWREEKKELDSLKAEKNKESKAINEVKKQGGDIKSQIAKVKKVAEKIEKKEEELKKIENERNSILINIPNLLDEEVPVGADDEENVTLRTFKDKPKFDFAPKSHIELCEENGWYDLDTAAKHSGARFYYIKGELVMLELALYNYVMSKLARKGYVPVEVPPMLRKESIGKSVSLADFDEAIYHIAEEDLCLIGTSEHALALLHEGQTLTHKDLPIKYAGISQCFRKEAGVTKDSKGIFRVHNFNKIEQFIFSKPEESDKFLVELIDNAEEIFKELEIPYRIVDICSGDIGSFAARKFDLEAYIPSQEKYREMVSASNYRDYGARRLNSRYQDENNEIKFVHTLNSTAIALTRALIALIENHQTKDGNVKVPKVLQPFLGGKKLLK
ncbi:MAG: serine--tRNA ligase [Nanoarchaeota archaeon]